MNNLDNKIYNEIIGIKTNLKMGNIKMNVLDGLLMKNNDKPYKFKLRILDELMGGYYIMDLIDDMLVKEGLTNLKCKAHDVEYLPKLRSDTDQVRVFTFYLFVNEF